MKATKLTDQQEIMFSPGKFVMLHPESHHPDAGRIGKIISRKGVDMLVEFFSDNEKSSYSVIPIGHWGPVPDSMVDEYAPAPGKRGWRFSERGIDLARKLGWGYTDATEGKK